jgi:hypothetical protein
MSGTRCEAQRLGVCQPYQQRTDKARAHSGGNRIQLAEPGPRDLQRFADYRDDGPQVLA